MPETQSTLPDPLKTRPAAAAAAAAPAARPNSLEYFIPSRRQIASLFTRENLVNFARTMAWVVPLTILIWVYAEREQVATAPGRSTSAMGI